MARARRYVQILFESVHDQGLLQAFFIKAHPIQDWVKTQDKIEFFLERIKAVQRPWFSACITPDDSMICDQYNTGGGSREVGIWLPSVWSKIKAPQAIKGITLTQKARNLSFSLV